MDEIQPRPIAERSTYEPPAIVWEECIEIRQTFSSGFCAGTTDECNANPQPCTGG